MVKCQFFTYRLCMPYSAVLEGRMDKCDKYFNIFWCRMSNIFLFYLQNVGRYPTVSMMAPYKIMNFT